MKNLQTSIFDTLSLYADNIAIGGSLGTLTYRELNTQLCYLVEELNALSPKGAKDKYCIIHTSSPVNCVIAQLAIILCGGICVILNAKTPLTYYNFQHYDEIYCVVTDALGETDSVAAPKIFVGDNCTKSGIRTLPIEMIKSNDVLYCVTTSGTTSSSKSILLKHDAVLNQVKAKTSLLNINKDSKVCIGTDMSFVATIWQVLAPIIVGGTIILLNEQERQNPVEFFRKVIMYNVNIMCTIPSFLNTFRVMKKQEKQKLFDMPKNLTVVSTGELLRADLARDLKQENIQLVNAYGQSECSDDVFHYIIPSDFNYDNAKYIPIGYPIANVEYVILDENEKIVSNDVPGELCVSGISVSQGYLNNAKETARKFKPIEGLGGRIFYFTGDIVNRGSNGELICLGRKDNQIKINGYRIEPENIETCCLKYPGIVDALVVKVVGDHNEYLHLLYEVEPDVFLNLQDFRRFLSEQLPSFMIPAVITKTKQIRYNSNGKKIRSLQKTEETISLQKLPLLVSEKNISKVALQQLIERVFNNTLNREVDIIAYAELPLKEVVSSLEFVYLVVELESILDIEIEVEKMVIGSYETFDKFIDEILVKYNSKSENEE